MWDLVSPRGGRAMLRAEASPRRRFDRYSAALICAQEITGTQPGLLQNCSIEGDGLGVARGNETSPEQSGRQAEGQGEAVRSGVGELAGRAENERVGQRLREIAAAEQDQSIGQAKNVIRDTRGWRVV